MKRNVNIPVIDAALIVLLLIVVVAGVYFLVQKNDIESQLEETRLDLGRTERQLNNLLNSNEEEELRAQLEALQGEEFPEKFPSLEQALDLYSDLAARSQELSIVLRNFNAFRTTLPLEGLDGEHLPGVAYSFTARGTDQDLLQILDMLNQYPTLVIQSLIFNLDQGMWNMDIQLTVFYGGEIVESL